MGVDFINCGRVSEGMGSRLDTEQNGQPTGLATLAHLRINRQLFLFNA